MADPGEARPAPAPRPRRVLGRPSAASPASFVSTLREENAAAVLLAAGTVLALVWANSPWADSYLALGEIRFGSHVPHLELSLAEWATHGLLTIFFFVVGLELKREFVVGRLRRLGTAIVPVVAAVGGMAAPAAVYVLINLLLPGGDLAGWAIPVATDIAFAVAVLALFGRRLPAALRVFLLTLAVADDLLGIIVIAVCYAAGVAWWWLLGSLAAIALFAALVRLRRTPAPLLFGIAVLAWYALHASGIHATIAGAALGLTVPAVVLPGHSAKVAPATRYQRSWQPVSAGIAVPMFAFFAAGVPLDLPSLAGAASDPVALGVYGGLVVGKPLGIMAGTWLLLRFTRAALDDSVRWLDLLAVACTAGIGFTVSLLIGELAFDSASPHATHLKAAILLGSLTAAGTGAVLLTVRTRRRHRTDDPIR